MGSNNHHSSIQKAAITSFLLVGSLLFTACSSDAGSGATAAVEQSAAATDATVEATAETTGEAAATEAAATEAATTEAAATEAAATEAAATEAATTEAAAPTVQKLNLNEVSGEQLLATIPNFGNRMVREFEEYRPYISIQQFRQEIGKYVDEAQVAEYEKYVFVPINVNEADEATLQQVPGLDAAAAAALVAGRPYASNAAFLDALAQIAPQADAAAAAAYLAGE